MLAQSASQPSSTPEKSHTEDRKRKRDVLSCLDCRRRKLKCDRCYPACSRCVKGGVAASCTYKGFHEDNDGNLDESDGRIQKRARGPFDAPPPNRPASVGREIVPGDFMHSASIFSTQSRIIKSLENRLATLESMLTQPSTIENLRLEGPHSIATMSKLETRGARGPETHLFKGRGVRTQFYGPSNPTSLLAHVRHLSCPSWVYLLTNNSFLRSGYS